MGECYNVCIILRFHFRHSDSCVLIHTKSVVVIHFQIIAGVCLTENEVEHLQEGLCVLVGIVVDVVKLCKVVHHLCNADFADIPAAEPLQKVVFPNAFLFADGLIGPVRAALLAVFFINISECAAANLRFFLHAGASRRHGGLSRLDCISLGFQFVAKGIGTFLFVDLFAIHHHHEAVFPHSIVLLVHACTVCSHNYLQILY